MKSEDEPVAQLDFQPSYREDVRSGDVAESLRAGRLDPRFLYEAEQQADLWRAVFSLHSPIHGNPEFARIYDEAFRSVSAHEKAGKIWLIGLGPGTGLKEANLISHLRKRGHEVLFSAVDVSHRLVLEATESAMNQGADVGNGLVGDLTDTSFLQQWLNKCGEKAQRLYTFFGLVPNLSPSTVTRLFHAVLRPGDALLCSVHLAPVGEDRDLATAMTQVRPQYDNAETLAWLQGALRECGLSEQLDNPVMTIGESEGVPAFLALASWIDDARKKPLEVFRSLRYTPALFEDLLRGEGFHFERLAMTACREEAIWVVRL